MGLQVLLVPISLETPKGNDLQLTRAIKRINKDNEKLEVEESEREKKGGRVREREREREGVVGRRNWGKGKQGKRKENMKRSREKCVK